MESYILINYLRKWIKIMNHLWRELLRGLFEELLYKAGSRDLLAVGLGLL